MGIAQRVVNALRGGTALARPRPGRMVRPEALDRWREYPADGLTPSRLAAVLRAADTGAVSEVLALFEQMEEKDAHLYSVANTRRLAVTGLKWRIISATETQEGVDRAAADEAAAYCREVLAAVDGLDEVLQHLALAIGRNIAVAENVWEPVGDELRLVEVAAVDFDRLAFDELGQTRILTRQEPYEGMALPPGKFVVHTPHAVSGHPMRGGLLRVSALAYLGKHFAMKDWLVFAEVFGMPLRVARYEPSATPEEKRELLAMLRSLGADAAGIFSKAVDLNLVEAGRGKAPPPYENICTFFNRELSKAWLGQTLTVEPSSSPGSLAATRVHNEVRLDLRQDDLLKEARTIRRDVLGPLARLKFGTAVPVPHFQRAYDPPRDLRELADILKTAVNDLRMPVPVEWARRVLGIPAGSEGEAILGQ